MPSVSTQADALSGGVDILVHGPNYEGFVGIDSITHGRSAGGVRIADDLALGEIRALAREMTLKYSLFYLPRGGAKAGLRMSSDLSAEERREALRDFGRRLAPILWNGIYNPGMDMNCGPDELREIYRGAGLTLGELTDTSWFTAISVYHALHSMAAGLDGARPLELAIEGFGSVARHLADRLDPSEFRVRWVATLSGAVHLGDDATPRQLAESKSRHGDDFVHELGGETCSRDDVLRAPVDVLLPSSRTWVIGEDLARDLAARAIVPIANAPYAGRSVEILHDRGIPLMPGYLSNCGGVLASSLYDQGLDAAEVETLFAQEYRPLVDAVLQATRRTGRPGTEVAESVARAHLPERPAVVHRSLARRVYDRFLARRMPRSYRGRIARETFIRNCRRVVAELGAWEATA